MTDPSLAGLQNRWHPCTPFTHRLAALRRVFQSLCDIVPAPDPYEPRVAVTVRLGLEDLEVILHYPKGKISSYLLSLLYSLVLFLVRFTIIFLI